MKKFLSLLLALLLCLSFIVSCEKEEAPSTSEPSSASDVSSSSEPSSSEPSNEDLGLLDRKTEAKYYGVITKDNSDNATGPSNVHMVYDAQELQEKISSITGKAFQGDNISEISFENNYVFILEVSNYYMCRPLGFRDITKTEDGYLLIMDVLRYNDSYSVNYTTGEASYGMVTPEGGFPRPKGICYAIIIPKSEFEEQPSTYDIEIQKVVYDVLIP